MSLELMPHKTFIYALVDPRNGIVRYVGKANDPEARRLEHLRYPGSNPHKDRWLAQIVKVGLLPAIQILEECGEDWAERERHWIAFHRGAGSSLTNLTDGGEGMVGYVHTEENKKRMSESHKKLWTDPEYRRERLELLQSAQSTSEYRARLLERMASPEIREKISASAKKQWADKDVRTRMKEALRLGHTTEEARANHSTASRKVWDDPALRAKSIAAAATPEAKKRHHESLKKALASPEERARLSAQTKAAWADPDYRRRRAASLNAYWVKRREREAAEREQQC